MILSTTLKGYDACEVINYNTYPGLIACAVLFAVFFIAFFIAYSALKAKKAKSQKVAAQKQTIYIDIDDGC